MHIRCVARHRLNLSVLVAKSSSSPRSFVRVLFFATGLGVPPGTSAFVLRSNVVDSWFTTMIGKKSSLIELQRLIRDVNPVCVRTTTFTQGKQARWGLAWTFTPDLHVDQMSSTPSDQNLSAFAVPLGLASIVDPISVFISQRCWGMTVKSPILLLVYRSQDPEQRSAPSDFRIDLLPVSENVTRVKVSPRDNQRPDTVASFLAELKDHLPRPTPR